MSHISPHKQPNPDFSISGCFANSTHMQITKERHLFFFLHESSLLATHYFTVIQLVLAQGLRCALHSALGNQCSL